MKGHVEGTMTPPAPNPCEGERKGINSELWHACAGPLVTLPPVGSLVVYFPQGHSEQVAASMQRSTDTRIPNYPNLPSKLICLLHNVTLHADAETDEVYAQMTLQPVNTNNKEALLTSDLALNSNRPQTEFFCKTLTASDTSTHGGFSVPRRAAEKIFPPLDFTMQPPVQELQARDLHDNVWTFRHIYRGQPKRHLLTTGWSLFVSGKRLVSGDSVLFIRDEKSQLLLGIRRASKQPNNISSSVLSSDSMHIGILAAAAHAAANNSPFTVFYNPRASPSEFVIPLAKYNKAIYTHHISLGMRFRMTFETEESGIRRYMGTITGISDLDPVRWKNSQWRNLQVGWDESAAGERRSRVSIWEIEPVVAPFFICPPPFFRSKLSRQPQDDYSDIQNILKRVRPWSGEEISISDPPSQSGTIPGLSLVQWMNMRQNQQPDHPSSVVRPVLHNLGATNLPNQLSLQAQFLQQNSIQLIPQNPLQQLQINQMPNMPIPSNQSGTITPQQPYDSLQQRQNLVSQAYPLSQTQNHFAQSTHVLVPSQVQQQQPLNPTLQPPQSSILQHQLPQLPFQQQQLQRQQQGQMPIQLYHQMNQQPQILEQEIQVQLLQKLQQQQESLMPQPILQQQQPVSEQKTLLKASQNTYVLSQQNSGTQQITKSMPHPVLQQQQPVLEQQKLLKASQNTNVFSQQSTGSQQITKSVPPMGLHQCQQQQVMEAELARMILPAAKLPTARKSRLETADDVPCCSTLPSTNNDPGISQTIRNRTLSSPVTKDKILHSAMTTLSPGVFEALESTTEICKELPKNENKVKPPLVISKVQKLEFVAPHAFLGPASQMDFLDSSSSATSTYLPQAEGHLQQSLPLSSFNQPPFFRSTASGGEIQASDPGNNDLFGVNDDCMIDIPQTAGSFVPNSISTENDYLNNLPSGNMLGHYSSKEAQQDMSTSYVSQSFGVPDVAFNSINSTNDSSFLNKSSRAPPSLQKMRTYTKVYKRGAVGRSIDITRYSGYHELKQDLARMFSIGGQLEDLQRIGWKLVYVDQENDVLLVGDDPWEEFVSCVRCIRILSPQEVQQMSLDGDLGNTILPNQPYSGSDGPNVWRDESDQNPVNPSALCYENFG